MVTAVQMNRTRHRLGSLLPLKTAAPEGVKARCVAVSVPPMPDRVGSASRRTLTTAPAKWP